MEKSRKIIDIVFKTISKLSDEEIECIINSGAKRVVLAGKAQLKEPMVHILKHRSVLDVCVVSDNEVDNSTSLGAVRIYENRF